MQEQKKNNPFHWRFITVMFFVGLIVVLAFFWTNGRTRNRSKEMTFAFNSWHYSREDSKEASAALAKAGLTDYQWKEGALEVPEKEKARYETVLASSRAFPHAPSDVHQESLREMGLFESESKSRLRDLYAAARQLEQTLGHFSTKIDYATVGVRARNEQNGLIRKTVITASIGVWTRDDVPMTKELITAITVAARHQLGIDENDNISILDLRNGKSWLGTDEGLADPESAVLKEKEAFWKARLRDHFRQIPGLEIDLNFEKNISSQVRERPAAVLGHPGFSTFADDPENGTWQNASLDKTPAPHTDIQVKIGIPQDFIRSQLADKNDSVALLGETNRLIDQVQRDANAILTPLTESRQINSENTDTKINVVILNKPIPEIVKFSQNPTEAKQLVTLNKIDASSNPQVLENNNADSNLKSPIKSQNREKTAVNNSVPSDSQEQNSAVIPNNASLLSNQPVSEKVPDKHENAVKTNVIQPPSSPNETLPDENAVMGFARFKNWGNTLWQKHHLVITIGFFTIFAFLALIASLKKRKLESSQEGDLLENYQPKPETKALRIKEKHENEFSSEQDRQSRLKELFEKETDDDYDDEPIVRIDQVGHHPLPRTGTSSSTKVTEKPIPSKTVSSAALSTDPTEQMKKDQSAGHFDFLNQFSPGQLARLFEKERAPFIAVALHFMIQDQRDAILAVLPREKSSKILSFLSQPFKIESSLIAEVERALRERCRNILNNSF